MPSQVLSDKVHIETRNPSVDPKLSHGNQRSTHFSNSKLSALPPGENVTSAMHRQHSDSHLTSSALKKTPSAKVFKSFLVTN